jgi:hypothetical protein
MPTDPGVLLNQIAAIDNMLANAAVAGAISMGDGSSNASFNSIDKLIAARNSLQSLYDRITGTVPVATRGRITGLPGGTVAQNQNWQ